MVLDDGRLDFGIAGQGAPPNDTQSIGRFLLGDAVVTDSVIHHYARSFLCDDAP